MQEVTIKLSDEVYQRVVNYAQRRKMSVEQVILMSVYSMLSEELDYFQEQVKSNSSKLSNPL